MGLSHNEESILAADRVRRFLYAYSQMGGLHQEELHTVGARGELHTLTRSDLTQLVREIMGDGAAQATVDRSFAS